MLVAVSDVIQSVDKAFWILISISAILLLGITAVMIMFAVKYNRKKNRTTTQIYGHMLLELTWIIIPTFIVIYMFFVGFEGFLMMRDVPPDAKPIKVTGQKWFWTFTYPDVNVSDSRLFVPVNTPIKLEITAKIDDVNHSLYIPAMRVKEDAIPGKINYMWIQPDRIGTFSVLCAEYCGRDHAKMITKMEVLSPEDFSAWIEQKLADRYQPIERETAMNPDSEAIQKRDGKKLYETYCISCHGVKGQGGLVEGARDFTSLQDWKNGLTVPDIYKTLEEGIVGTQMASYSHLPPWDRFALAHYVRDFYTGDDLPTATREEIDKLWETYELDKVRAPAETISIEQAMQAIAEDINQTN